MRNAKFIIYALVDPRDETVRYVGRSSNGIHRARAHGLQCVLSKEKNQAKKAWIESLHANGLYYRIEIVEAVTSQAELDQREVFWISEAKKLGQPLVNMTSGGDGSSGYVPTAKAREIASERRKGVPLSDEHRRAIAQAMNAPALKARLSEFHRTDPREIRHREELAKARIGTTHSADTKAKMSAAHKGRTFSDEHRANLAKAGVGRVASAETRAKLSAWHTGRTASNEARAKMSKARKGKPLAPEHREKIAAANRRRAVEYKQTKAAGAVGEYASNHRK